MNMINHTSYSSSSWHSMITTPGIADRRGQRKSWASSHVTVKSMAFSSSICNLFLLSQDYGFAFYSKTIKTGKMSFLLICILSYINWTQHLKAGTWEPSWMIFFLFRFLEWSGISKCHYLPTCSHNANIKPHLLKVELIV